MKNSAIKKYRYAFSPLKYVVVRMIAAMEPRMIMITATDGITH